MAQTAPQNPAEPETLPASPPAMVTNGRTQPPIVPPEGTDQIQLCLVNCSWGLDCLLANLFLPASTRLNQLELKFDNPASNPAKILNSALSGRGELTLHPLPNDALSIPQEETTFPAQTITSIPLTINRSVLPPEQYTDKIYITQANQSNRLILPLI
ncbi:hypothetical protein [Leptolyngbya sp. ST-U4]|uniref:hypothetical protein n=1 Tax=Leptolyngbya sp. ST-U4 TaxID=2933912 RepID=UPI00329713AE